MIVETHVFTTMRRASVLSLVGATTGLLLCVALFLSFCTEIGLRERGVAEIFSSTPVAKIPSSHWLAMLTALRKLSGVVSPLSGSSVLGTGLPMGHTVWLNPSIKTQIVSFGIIR